MNLANLQHCHEEMCWGMRGLGRFSLLTGWFLSGTILMNQLNNGHYFPKAMTQGNIALFSWMLELVSQSLPSVSVVKQWHQPCYPRYPFHKHVALYCRPREEGVHFSSSSEIKSLSFSLKWWWHIQRRIAGSSHSAGCSVSSRDVLNCKRKLCSFEQAIINQCPLTDTNSVVIANLQGGDCLMSTHQNAVIRRQKPHVSASARTCVLCWGHKPPMTDAGFRWLNPKSHEGKLLPHEDSQSNDNTELGVQTRKGSMAELKEWCFPASVALWCARL